MSCGAAKPVSAKPASARKKGSCTAPRHLLAKLLLALVDCGDIAIGRAPPGAEPTNCLIRLVLVGFDTPNAFALAASALVGLCQVGCSAFPCWLSHICSAVELNALVSLCQSAFAETELEQCHRNVQESALL